MAANPPIGSNAWEGVLGVVDVIYDDVYLGRTTADTEIGIEQDIKDIIFQQSGTKYADKVRTGVVHPITATFGDITTTLLEKMHDGWSKSGGGDSMKLGRNLYTLWSDSAKKLELVRVDSEGNRSTDPKMTITFYKAFPEITGPIMWGADTQRNVPVTFHTFFDETNSAYGYSGNASSVGLIPAV